jgi:hypothetical protein
MTILLSSPIGYRSISSLQSKKNTLACMCPNKGNNLFSTPSALSQISKATLRTNKKFEVRRIFPEELLNNRWLKIEGLLWCACWAWFLYDSCKHGRESLRLFRLGLSCGENRSKWTSELKETCHNVINLSGTTASIALWSERAKFFTLGKFTLLLQKTTFIGFFITSGFSMEKTARELRKEKISLMNAQDPKDILKHRLHYRSAQLDLASHISTIVWAILGIAELCAGVVIAPWLMTSVFMASCALACVSIGYSCSIQSKIDTPSAT